MKRILILFLVMLAKTIFAESPATAPASAPADFYAKIAAALPADFKGYSDREPPSKTKAINDAAIKAISEKLGKLIDEHIILDDVSETLRGRELLFINKSVPYQKEESATVRLVIEIPAGNKMKLEVGEVYHIVASISKTEVSRQGGNAWISITAVPKTIKLEPFTRPATSAPSTRARP